MKVEKTDAQLMQEINISASQLSPEGKSVMLLGYLVAMLGSLKRKDPALAENLLNLIKFDLENLETMTKH